MWPCSLLLSSQLLLSHLQLLSSFPLSLSLSPLQKTKNNNGGDELVGRLGPGGSFKARVSASHSLSPTHSPPQWTRTTPTRHSKSTAPPTWSPSVRRNAAMGPLLRRGPNFRCHFPEMAPRHLQSRYFSILTLKFWTISLVTFVLFHETNLVFSQKSALAFYALWDFQEMRLTVGVFYPTLTLGLSRSCFCSLVMIIWAWVHIPLSEKLRRRSDDFPWFFARHFLKTFVTSLFCIQAALEHGMGPRGSALICGYTNYHRLLESSLADLKKKEV